MTTCGAYFCTTQPCAYGYIGTQYCTYWDADGTGHPYSQTNCGC